MDYSQHIFVLMSLTSIITSSTATLTPSSPTLSVDCGGQQTFTCSVTGVAALWITTGLDGITAPGTSGMTAAGSNNRVTTTDSSGLVQTSTITITGFTVADDGGTVQCINQADSAVQGMTTVSLGPPQCGTVGVVQGNDSCPSFTFTPQGSVLPLTVVVSYQLVGDPSSAGSLNCDYPVDPRMCRLVVPGGTYTVRATPQNNCGSPSSTCSAHTVPVPANCTLANRPAPVPMCILCGVIPASVVLIIIIIIIIVVVLLVTRHCCKKSAKGGSSSRQEELYAQVEGKKVYEDIKMTDSPAYGPTSHAPPVYM